MPISVLAAGFGEGGGVRYSEHAISDLVINFGETLRRASKIL
jgi:hypothetical protein